MIDVVLVFVRPRVPPWWRLRRWLLASPPAVAQQADNAIVVGTVLDESGAPIPGAPVVVTHVATGVSTAVVTNHLGQYRTPPLRIGAYDVSVELDGFQRFVQHAASCSASATCATSTSC